MTDTLFTPELPGATPSPGTCPPAVSPAAGGRAFTITVHGDPVGQGAIRHGKTGVGYHANGKILKPWRAKVRAAAEDAIGRHGYAAPPKLTRTQKAAGEKRPAPICVECGIGVRRHGLFLGAVGLAVVATFSRPKSDPRRAFPLGQNLGDWDHHGRSISDALTGVVFADDAQIIDGSTAKTYPGGHRDALTEPGVVIHVWEVTTR